MITKTQVQEIQDTWGAGVVKIGSLKHDRQACENYASAFIDELYAYKYAPVLFKPTKCEAEQFRPSKEEALSYFIAGDDRVCNEDKGFAIQPWTKVRFENSNIILEADRAFAMGNYFFTDEQGHEVKVEYTFGYKLIDNQLKIDLHHSSFPYSSHA
ncbi:MAG: hypothetical protein HRT67_11865 [Flavobacteriaceae bacterium]|nr:hypothetical protein [Flavobacteriaceae bacterium]